MAADSCYSARNHKNRCHGSRVAAVGACHKRRLQPLQQQPVNTVMHAMMMRQVDHKDYNRDAFYVTSKVDQDLGQVRRDMEPGDRLMNDKVVDRALEAFPECLLDFGPAGTLHLAAVDSRCDTLQIQQQIHLKSNQNKTKQIKTYRRDHPVFGNRP